MKVISMKKTTFVFFNFVVQGITTPPLKWEPILKQNLTLTSHCATFEQIPAENVAIIANIDKW